jgi:hypothetical protein
MRHVEGALPLILPPRVLCTLLAVSMLARGQFVQLGPPPVTADVAHQQIRTLLDNVDPSNRPQTVKRLSDLARWYRDILDEELIAAWAREGRENLPDVIEQLADPRVAAGVIEFSWRQQREAIFVSAYTPTLRFLMERYADSATPFLNDLRGTPPPNLARPVADHSNYG